MIQLHLSLRSGQPANLDQWLARWRQLKDRSGAGFLRLTASDADWQAISSRANELRGVKRLVVVGTGGSSLGTQVIAQALMHSNSAEIEFLESPDPSVWTRSVARWNASTHVLIVSKSGSTLETLVWIERLAAAGKLDPATCTLIASPGDGPLHRWATRHGVSVLTIPPDVGGRYSVLTAVGMLPAAILGLNPAQFREGASWALQRPELAAQLAETAWCSWQRGEWITQLWSYSAGLGAFGQWWQQLWAESLAKKSTRAGGVAPRASSPMACIGPRDQHSVLQQLIDGARDKFVFVMRVQALEADAERFQPTVFPELPMAGRQFSLGEILQVEARSFERSLVECGIPHLSISVRDLSESSLGAMFMLWQMTVAMLGERMGIDPFDQPGVEVGKKYALEILAAK